MKGIFLAVILAFGCLISIAQTSPVTPFPVSLDTVSKMITYQGVVEVKGVKADELYKRIDAWFRSYYKNPSEVIRENDSVKFIMVGKPRFRLLTQLEKDGPKVEGNSTVQYTVTIAARDGRFRYELTAFNWKQPSYYACEKWLDIKASSYQPVFNEYLQQLDKNSLETITSLKSVITKERVTKAKDAW
jgi:hypothetical protein